MLTIEPPFYPVRGTTVFRDHEDPDQFWVLPGPPTLLAPGPDQPGFTLYKYRRDLTDNPALDPTRAKGGGLAFFDVVAGPPPLAALASDVASLAGRPDARVAPVVFRSGTVRAIIAHAQDDRLLTDVVQTTATAPVAPHRATFALAATPEGATFLEQAALGGALPVGVAYELRFLALTPSLHARVTMDYDRIYDRFEASVGITYAYVQAKFDLDLAWLVEHDLVHVDIVSFTDDADAQRQRDVVMGLVAARIQADFFRTGIPPEPASGDALSTLLGGLLGGQRVTSASALFVLKARAEAITEHKDFELAYEGRTAVELTHVSTGLLAALVAGGPAPRIVEVDLDDDFFASLAVDVVGDLDPDALPELTRAVVHLVKDDHPWSLELLPGEPARGRFEVALTDRHDDAYEARFELFFDPDVSGGDPVVTAGPLVTRDRVLVVNPLEHLEHHRVSFLLGPVDPVAVPRVHVQVRLVTPDGTTELGRAELALDPGHPELTWRHHLPLGTGARTLVATAWEDPHGVVHDGPRSELEPGTTSLVVLGPYVDVLSVSVVPAVAWAEGISHAELELDYTDGDYVVARTLTFLAETGTTAQTVDIPLLDATRRTYRWRQVLFAADGPHETDWADSDHRVLVFGVQAPTTGDVRLVWVGDPGAAFGLRVDLRVSTAAGDQTASAFLRAGVDLDSTVHVPLAPDGRLRYHYEVRRVDAAGETLVVAGDAETGLLVVRAA